MKRVAVRIRGSVAHERTLLSSFAHSVNVAGDHADVAKRSEVPRLGSVDAIACWGWRQGSAYRKLGFNVLVFERGFVADRFHWTSVGLNGLNGRATFSKVDDGGKRWDEHFAPLMRPWREPADGYTLLMGQVPSDTAVREVSFVEWLHTTARTLASNGERVAYRAHPLAPQVRCPNTALLRGDINKALSGARRVVTYNSNSGVDSIMAGVPTVAVDQGSMAYPVATHAPLDEPITPDRTEWAHAIAWAQWLPKEFETGEAWSRLRELI
jgi:hypothetical protein